MAAPPGADLDWVAEAVEGGDGDGDVEMADGEAAGGGGCSEQEDEDDELLREWSRRLVKWVLACGAGPRSGSGPRRLLLQGRCAGVGGAPRGRLPGQGGAGRGRSARARCAALRRALRGWPPS